MPAQHSDSEKRRALDSRRTSQQFAETELKDVSNIQHVLEETNIEMMKILLANNLESLKNTSQILQGITGLLLTSHIVLMSTSTNRPNTTSNNIPLLIIYILPALLFTLSLSVSFLLSLPLKPHPLVFGNLDTTLEVYETIIRDYRKGLFLPSFLSISGIIAFIGFVIMY